MAFETIEKRGSISAATPIPPNGVSIKPHKLNRKNGVTRFIILRIGAELARQLGWTEKCEPASIQLGSDNDFGKIAIVASRGGAFAAKGGSGKNYAIWVNQETAKGLFSLEFENFVRDGLEVIKPTNGQPRYTSFLATNDMLSPDEN